MATPVINANLLHAVLLISETSDLHITEQSPEPASVPNENEPNFPKKNEIRILPTNIIHNKGISPTTPFSPLTPQDPCVEEAKQSESPYKSLNIPATFAEDRRRKSLTASVSSVCWMDLLTKMETLEQYTTLKENGYTYIGVINKTIQGQLIQARKVSNKQIVAIKVTNKGLFQEQIAVQDGMNFCVSENCIKEALILKYLTVDNRCIGDHIVNYLDFFETDSDYHLVMEYVDSEMNLKQFVRTCQRYLKQKKIKLKKFQKIIKYLFWQIVVTVRWLHNDMNCAHLDLCIENVMLKNCSFTEKDGVYEINPDISVCICDFGVSELFWQTSVKPYQCCKSGLSLDNEPYLAPKVYDNQVYNASMVDTWSLGMILFECVVGRKLYTPMDVLKGMFETKKTLNGYTALQNGKLKKYLAKTQMIKNFTSDSFDLLLTLLKTDENERATAVSITKHRWFRLYYQNYHKRIDKKSQAQKLRCLKQRAAMINFPYYSN